MQAKETKLRDILEGTKQYLIPLFQRSYSWDRKQWDILWEDLIELCNAENPRPHFMGSIVNMPIRSVPEGVTKYSLIDGQQRLATIFILLILLRNQAREDNNKLAEEIESTLIVNQYKEGSDYYKFRPTQFNREAYDALVNNNTSPEVKTDQIYKAYGYFERSLKKSRIKLDRLKDIITDYLTVVSIVLDIEDNPYLVFESLNAKGQPLTQADLIKNYIFMNVHIDRQELVYKELWQPIQEGLGENIEEFVRHFLMKEGRFIKKNEIYYIVKESINFHNATDYLKDLCKYSSYYEKLLDPTKENDNEIKLNLDKLNRIEVTTAYPFLLNLYNDYQENYIDRGEFLAILIVLQNYLMRRFICGVPTNQLNKIFPPIYAQLRKEYPNNYVEGTKKILSNKGYPKDYEVKQRMKDVKLYGAADRETRTRIILEEIENSYFHRERIDYSTLTIEHIMPQTLTEEWRRDIGPDAEMLQELFLHNIGNLTLTAYNSQLSNSNFTRKKEIYRASHLEINRRLIELDTWGREQIEKRTEELADIIVSKVWPSFGEQVEDNISQNNNVTGTRPSYLLIFGQGFEVNSWKQVLTTTINTIAMLDPEKFDLIRNNHPRLIPNNTAQLRTPFSLANGVSIETHFSAKDIMKYCNLIKEVCELDIEDWDVKYE